MSSKQTPSKSFPRCQIKLKDDMEESEFERLAYAREKALETLNHRRDKSWKIFSWVSSILVASIGGVVVLIGNENSCITLEFRPLGLLFSIAIIIISTYSILWMNQNLRLAKNAGEIVQHYSERLGVDDGFEERLVGFGYVYTVAFLAIAAVLVILLARPF